MIAVDVTKSSADRSRRGRPSPSGVRAAVLRTLTGSDRPLPRIPETVMRCMAFASADTVATARNHADLVISPEVTGIGMLEWRRLPDMRRAGIEAAQRALVEHSEILERLW